MRKSIHQINQRIREGNARVVTAEQMPAIVAELGEEGALKEVDVVTTGTFGAMCSSGAFLNFGHAEPPIRMERIWLNDVEAYGGLAAVDAYIGATQQSTTREEQYGGAHVIEDLISGKPVKLRATAYGTDCYPRKEIETYITLESINQAYIFNPRNVYQNYTAATNSSNKTIYTYMGKLMPNFGNITFSSAGQLSPLLNDPYYRTIGIGTRIFIGGGQGYVAWQGTQHNPGKDRLENGTPSGPAGTLALIGDMKKMNKNFIRAATFHGYGITMYVGVGIPIPVLDEEMVEFLRVKDEDIYTEIMDYSVQRRNRPSYGKINYKQLRSGSITLKGKKIQTGSFSSYAKALEIANLLKSWITKGHFLMTNFAAPIPMDEKVNTLNILSKEEL